MPEAGPVSDELSVLAISAPDSIEFSMNEGKPSMNVGDTGLRISVNGISLDLDIVIHHPQT